MRFDSIIIGGGIAGLTCGIKCAAEGLQCAIISSGMSALHFSSGSLDLLSYYPERRVVYAPFDVLARLRNDRPDHPYAKCGDDLIEEALSFLQDEVAKEGLLLCSNDRQNHFHITALGTLKPTFLSQRSVFNPDLVEAFQRRPDLGIISFEEFRDFNPTLLAVNLKQHKLFQSCDMKTGSVELAQILRTRKNPHEFRSIEIARLFDQGHHLQEIAARMRVLADGCGVLGVPAFLGITRFRSVYDRMSTLTGKIIYEIPTLPPSILGMRLDEALKARFADLGGVYIAGDRVVSGQTENHRIKHIFTRNYGDNRLEAEFFVLATGSFFSGGLSSRLDHMQEPIFDCALEYQPDRKRWYASSFFARQSHPFLNYGVLTDARFNPFDSHGKCIENLFCAGAILAGYNPIKEGSGSGVAISSGYAAARRIIEASAARTR